MIITFVSKSSTRKSHRKSLRPFSVFDYQFFKWLISFREAQFTIHHSQFIECRINIVVKEIS